MLTVERQTLVLEIGGTRTSAQTSDGKELFVSNSSMENSLPLEFLYSLFLCFYGCLQGKSEAMFMVGL